MLRKKFVYKYLFLLLFLSTGFLSRAQKHYTSYNVDSLLKKISVNHTIRIILKDAGNIYRKAGIPKNNISLNAFKVAYLEKCFLDSGRIKVHLPKDSAMLPYSNPQILTVVDFTKNGHAKRFITIDIAKRKILHNTLVSHGSATGKGSETLIRDFGWTKDQINNKYDVPLFFGNTDSSSRSSLGLVLTLKGDYPDNACHLCKYFLSKPHKCGVILAGLEEGINDNDVDREIVIHTTGSKDFSDPVSTQKIAAILHLSPDSISGLKKQHCACTQVTSTVSSYASACGIADNKGFIGRSSGCLVLPEQTHLPVMNTIESGSLIFVYSNAMAPESTHYFQESSIIKTIIEYAGNK